MRISFLPFALLFCALVFSPGCSEDNPVTPDPNDTTHTHDSTDTTIHNPIDTLGPCQVPTDTSIGKNGFILDGSGFSNVRFSFDPDSSTLGYTTLFGPDGTLFQASGPIYLTGGNRAVVTMTIEYPDIDKSNKQYIWEPGDTISPTGVRLEIAMNGATRVLKPDLGQVKVIQAKTGSFSGYGTFCGIMKDSLTGTEVQVKSGKFYID
jgi:hypothetical protein